MDKLSNKQLELIKLLQSLALLLRDNKYDGISEIIGKLNATITDLENTPYEGITLNIKVGKVSDLINAAVAFDGMHLSKDEVVIWRQIKYLINPGRRADAPFSIVLSRLF